MKSMKLDWGTGNPISTQYPSYQKRITLSTPSVKAPPTLGVYAFISNVILVALKELITFWEFIQFQSIDKKIA
jgi:hypothetical protein